MQYQCSKEQFEKDTASHTMEVKLDKGVHRHLVFTNKGSSVYRFDITTWPGYLCISGDMGCYVFSRLPDMFEFFRNPAGNINPSYWAEKLQSDARYRGCKEYSEKKFRETVQNYVESWVDDTEPSDDDEAQLQEEIKELVLCAENEWQAHEKAAEFEFKGEPFFSDFWEHDLTDYTSQFIWCLYAIVHAINKYDQAGKISIASGEDETA